MRDELLLLAASLCGGILCMILHELPKVLLYRRLIKKEGAIESKMADQGFVNPIHFIDPIGLLFCAVFRVGFSKPAYYRMKKKQWNQILGVAGMMSLLLQFMAATAVLKFAFGMNSALKLPLGASIGYEFLIYFFSAYAIIAIGMLLTNLFPMMATDMAWLMTAKNPVHFITLLRNDYILKLTWVFVVILGVLPQIAILVFKAVMG